MYGIGWIFDVEITNNDEEFKLRENSESDPKIFHGKRGSQVNGKEQEAEFTLVPGILEKLESLGKNSGLEKQEARSKKNTPTHHAWPWSPWGLEGTRAITSWGC